MSVTQIKITQNYETQKSVGIQKHANAIELVAIGLMACK